MRRNCLRVSLQSKKSKLENYWLTLDDDHLSPLPPQELGQAFCFVKTMAFRLTKRIIKTAIRTVGYEVVPKTLVNNGPGVDPVVDIDDATKKLFHYVQSNTLSGIERVAAL